MVETPQRMTLDEFLKLPERKPALEFEDGVVTQKAWSGGRHSVLQTTVLSLINDGARIRKQCLALPELQVTYAGMSRTPDVAVYRWDRIPRDADGVIMDDFTDPPDVVIEIVSLEESLNRHPSPLPQGERGSFSQVRPVETR